MGFADFMSGTSNFLAKVIDFIIFWKNWDTFSKYVLIGFVLFLFVAYTYVKSSILASSNNPRHKKQKHFR